MSWRSYRMMHRYLAKKPFAITNSSLFLASSIKTLLNRFQKSYGWAEFGPRAFVVEFGVQSKIIN